MLNLYEKYYKLSADPFRLNPDHLFAFGHRSYAKAKAYLEYALQRGEGFIVITGGPGTGKTTLINGILASLNKTRVRVATLTSTRLVPLDLLHMVAASFGLHFDDTSKATLLLGLEEYLIQQSRQGWRAILIVDEAQDLSPSAVEELRLLANLQHNNRLMLQVFLVGHVELRDVIRGPAMEHLRQRIIAASHLEPMDLDETVDYIEHRLCRAGWQGDPSISADVLRLIHQFSGGIPRRVNMICSRLFLYGSMEGKHKLVGEDAWNVISDLRRELLVAAEDSAQVGLREDIAAQTKSEARAMAQSLPRPQSFGHADQIASCRSLEGAGKPPPDDHRRARGGRGRSTRSMHLVRENYPRIEPVVGEEDLEDVPAPAAHSGADESQALTLEVDDGHKAAWRWSLAAVVVLAVGLSLTTSIKTDLRDRLVNFVRPVAVETHTPPPTISAEAEPQGPLQEELSTTEAPRVPPVVADEDASVDTPSAPDGTLAKRAQQSVELSPEAPEVVAMASESDRRPDKAGPRDAQPVTAGPVDRQAAAPVVSVNERLIEAEHARLRNEAEQLHRQQLTAIEVPNQPEPSPKIEPAAKPAAALSDPSTERAAAAEHGSPGPVEADEIEPTPKASTEAADRRRDSAESASVVRAPAATKEARSISAPAASPPPVAVLTREPAAERSEPPAVSLPAPIVSPAPKSPPAPTLIATAPRPELGTSVTSSDQLRSALLGGQWNSQGKPAVLLPSEITYCKSDEQRIRCWSVPQNINTKFGPALYKVEGTLQDFSADGGFRLAYRTLVRLVAADTRSATSTEATPSTEGRWQVTEHAMRCELVQPDNIRCRDEKGVTRNYRR